jgi:hypothetical protein
MTDYRIDYRNESDEWENIENLGQDMSTGLDTEQEAIETFDSLMDVFDDEDEADYRLVEIDDDGFEVTLKETNGE